MASYLKSYVFPLTLTDTWKEEITLKTREKLTEMLGVEVDNVMAEYVIVMVGNKKNLEQIAHDLVDFIGDESAEQFVTWLGELLPKFEAAQAPAADRTQAQAAAGDEDGADDEMQSSAEEKPVQATEEKKEEKNAPPKRVISLKGLSKPSAEPVQTKTGAGSTYRGTIRSLNPTKTDQDDVIARRAQRFGTVEKPAIKKSLSSTPGKEPSRQRDEARTTGNKRREVERDSSNRLSTRLGPPVNVDQAELDARDTLGSHKKRRGDRERSERNDEHEYRGARSNRRKDFDRDHDMEEAGRSDKRRNSRSRDVAPPLPPSDGKNDSKAPQGFGQGMGPPVGFQGGPMGFGGYPPPFGGPMFYPPPGFGPMNPYAMGFPPQGMQPYGGPGYPRPLAAEMHNGGRGPRPFQNRKWVNPNVAKAEEAKADEDKAAADAGGGEASGVPQNTGAPAFAPRNPYYSSQMRPRFQNKTWVRQDPAKDEELNSSLPKTPPKELLESME